MTSPFPEGCVAPAMMAPDSAGPVTEEVLTIRVSLIDGPKMYKTSRDKEDGCIKVVLKP
ncbi:putative zinc-containing dehydrogenase [Caballeronia arvi]|uniref:Zinc-containing dehydrogenase n=1 Tax=Caballeronia arvi TaxID=1777135 RepID=A0A158L730_9BURK|nr:putative zinc-containing dehydrogenase [Caballeronia arvi]